jgi:hypothetical protein
MDGKWVEIRMIYGVVTPKVKHPTLVDKASVKPYSKNDMVHMMLQLEYVLPLLPNPETYYLLHCFQIFLRVGLALLVLGGHIIEKYFLAMWVVKDLE